MKKQVQLKKTVETFIRPVNSKVTEFRTIKKYMQYLQELANQMNMPYVNVSLDVGAAMNAYLLTWNEPEVFKNVIIHLGSFHFLKENFQVSVENMWWSIFEWLFTSSLRNFWYNFLDRSRGTSDAVSTLFIEDVFWVHSSGANYPYHKHQHLLGILLGNVCTCVRCWYLCPNNCSKRMHRWYIYCFHIFFRLF